MIEDAAQAFGAAGIATSVASTFSFFPTKNLFALGDGGLIAVNDPELAQRIRMLRFHGSAREEGVLYVGYNSRLDALQAAILRIFLPHIDGWNAARREAAARYAELGSAESSRRRSTSRATSTTCTASARPSATGSPPRSRRPRSASPSYYEPPLHLQPALALSRLLRGRLPGDREGGAREPLPADVGRDHRGAAGRGRRRPAARLGSRARA